ncbi:MAG: MMPL family transporter [Flavobacteriales bacterium]|nr:MMPL family transporter [Flavobacteriales bacterium]
MLSNLINNIINFFYKRSILFVFVLIAFLGVFVIGIFQININESIFSMLPKGNSFSKFSKLIDQGELTNQVVFTLDVEEVDSEELLELTANLSDSLNKYTNSYLKDITIERPNLEVKVFDYFYNNFPAFIDEPYYKGIDNKISKDSVSTHLSNAQRNLLAPGGFMFRDFILKDPISISGDFFKSLNEKSNISNLNVEDGFIFSEDKKQLLITAKTVFNATDNKKNIELYNSLNELKENWNKHYSKQQFGYFGTFQIGAENGIQVKKDTFLTLIITLIIILLILFIFYRKILIPLYFMLPLVFGAAFALGMMGYFKNEISGISIATGAVVFGIILDYSFIFLLIYNIQNQYQKPLKNYQRHY